MFSPYFESRIEHLLCRGDIVELDKLDLNTFVDGNSSYPIHIAIQYGNLSMIKYCIERGNDVNAIDFFKVTPLMLAAFYGNKKVVELLLSLGADKTLKNYWGKTAKDKAIENGHTELYDIL